MALAKQPIDISFAQGLDTKTDPFRVSPGKFLTLQNSVFDKAGRLTKRNGYVPLTTTSDTTAKYLTTFNGNLTSLGTTLQAYNAANRVWVDKGPIKPVDVSVLPAIRNTAYQGQADSVTASNGLACITYTDYVSVSGTVTPIRKYVVIDSNTGQNIIPPTVIPSDATYGTPRVFLVGSYFVILYTVQTTGYQLVYTSISTQNPNSVIAPITLGTYTPSSTLNFDALLVANDLYIAFQSAGTMRVTFLNQLLVQGPIRNFTVTSTLLSMASDTTGSSPIIYVSSYNSYNITVFAFDSNVNSILAPTTFSTGSLKVLNMSSTAQNGSVTLFYEIQNYYTYGSGTVQTDYIETVNITQAGVVGTPSVLVRSVGLASKAFLINGISYMLTVYNSVYEPTYFLIDGSGNVISKLAASNAGPYYLMGLPNVTVIGSVASVAYLYKDQIQAVNKTQGLANPAGVYSQLGVNIVSFNFTPKTVLVSEIGGNLNLTGGYLSMYDGVAPVEQGFFLYPENIGGGAINTGGNMADQQYYYVVTYEWADNQGNVFRSAPSIPYSVVVSGGGGVARVLLDIPTLRLTYKTDVTIVVYRWSAAQQIYYQTTSITAPIANDKTVDYISFTDTNSDAQIIGNNIVYTNGGVIEDIAAPATSIMTLFNNRLWLVDAEDTNLLWFSKQVIEATPVEMSDLLTMYIAPTTGAEGSTGPITALAPMDDKLIIFKQNALGYISGIGPDNTGANNGYSDFVLITSAVGSVNPQSIVLTPNGLMFQSNKGIWLLGRDLSTQYIGAPVETYTTGALVLSAVSVPTTNQIRFALDSGVTLMYDYYFQQWGTFNNIPSISSVLYENLDTFLNSYGQVLQESPGSYLDNGVPVLMSFTTSWINLAGIQGFERFYQMYLLGQSITPFKLSVGFGFNYNASLEQETIVSPLSFGPNYGGDTVWGSTGPWGGHSSVFEARVFPKIQKCESFQVSITEMYDSSYGLLPGAGLTLTGLNLIVGLKKGYRATNNPNRSFG